MQEAAMRNTLRLRLSSPELMASHGLTWVIRRQRMFVSSLPKMNAPISITTAPTGFNRNLQTYRDFIVESDQKEILVEAVSEWLLLDVNTRRIKSIPEHVLAIAPDFPSPEHCLPKRFSSISTPAVFTHTYQTTVRRHQTDFNGHLGNPLFVEIMLDATPGSTWEKYRIVELTIDYGKEAVEGDVLTSGVFQAEPTPDGRMRATYQLGRHKDLLASMEVVWQTT